MSVSSETFSIGRAAVASRTWVHRGRHLLTAIVKGSFGLRPDGPMALTQPTPIVEEDRTQRHSPIASLLHGSDLALVVPMPEVVVVGSAHASAGQRVQRMRVGLELVRDGATLFAKALQIVGPRRGRANDAPPEPAAFESMPIVYERAYGGMTYRENPVGVGLEPGADGLVQWPCILRSSADERVLEAKGAVAGLGPIPSVWPLRKEKRGALSHRDAFSLADVVLPDDFDERYFQASPHGQQTTEIRPGDVVVLTGMHPLHTKLRSSIPAILGAAVAQTRAGKRMPFKLRIDTVHLEPDGMRAEIVWRGAVLVSPEELEGIRVAGTLHEAGTNAELPDLSTLQGTVRSPASAQPALTGTMVLDPPPARPAPKTAPNAAKPVSPGNQFGGTQILDVGPAPGPPAAPPQAPPPKKDDRYAGTLIIEPEPMPTAARRQSTVEISSDAGPRSLPFQRGALGGGVAARPADADAPAPRSPWSEVKANVPLPQVGQKETLLVGEPSEAADMEERIQAALRERAATAKANEAKAPVAPPTPALPTPARPTPAVEPTRPVSVDEAKWRVDAPTQDAHAAPKPVPVVQPRVDLKGKLYKKK